MLAAPPLAAVLAAATFARLGLDADALAWALVQCLLVGLAASTWRRDGSRTPSRARPRPP